MKRNTWAGDRAGTRVRACPCPFAHTKLLLVDDIYVCLGSTLTMEVFLPELTARISAFADSVLKASEEVALERPLTRSLAVRLRNTAAWIFSPYYG